MFNGSAACFKSAILTVSLQGGGTVHLTGYLVPDEEGPMFPMEDMTDEEDEEIEEEETPPQLIKKRKLENGDKKQLENKKPRKEDEIKQAEAMKNILGKKKELY